MEGGCAHSEPAGLPLLNTSALLITSFRCLRFLVSAHLKGLLQCGGGRSAGEEASYPPGPSQGSELPWKSRREGNEGMPLPPRGSSSLHPKTSGHFHARQLKFQGPPYLGLFFAQESWGLPWRNVRVRGTPSHSALSSEAEAG